MENLINYEYPELERKGIFKRCFYKPTQSKITKKEYYFVKEEEVKLVSATKTKNYEALSSLHRRPDSYLKLIVLSSKDGRFNATQVYDYQNYSFNPASDVVLWSEGEMKRLVETLEKLPSSF